MRGLKLLDLFQIHIFRTANFCYLPHNSRMNTKACAAHKICAKPYVHQQLGDARHEAHDAWRRSHKKTLDKVFFKAHLRFDAKNLTFFETST